MNWVTMTSSSNQIPSLLRNDEKFAIDIHRIELMITGLTQFAATGDASTGVLAPGASATFDLDYTHVGGYSDL
jgi:hypothetical protein